MLGDFVCEIEEPWLDLQLGRHDGSGSIKPLRGLIDTGANRLCIPPQMLSGLELVKSGASTVQTATALGTADLFVAKLVIPRLRYSQVVEVVVPRSVSGNTPVLVGMSVLCDFNIWYHVGFGSWTFYRRAER